MSDTITSITQIPGIYAGHCSNHEAATGCTAIICPQGATAGVDVRGGAPASRETDLLRPEETVQVLHSVVLSGGSAYGLSASCGAAEELERRNIGLNVGVGLVPIVSSACVFDLLCGSSTIRPTVEDGARAVAAALDNTQKLPLETGCVGAGTGCTVAKLAGPQRSMKSGLGEGLVQAQDLICGAVAAVNACGDIVDPESGKPIAAILPEDGKGGLISSEDLLLSMTATMPLSRSNTTISCIVTTAKLDKAQCTKVAQMAADAYAHTIRPTHTSNDGDTIFVMATGQVEAPIDVVGLMATKALEKAIIDGVTSAKSCYGYTACCDLEDGATE